MSFFPASNHRLWISKAQLIAEVYLFGGAQTPLWLLQQDRGLVPVGFLRDGEDLEEPLQALAQACDVIEDLGVGAAAEREHRKVGGRKRCIVLVLAEEISKRDLAPWLSMRQQMHGVAIVNGHIEHTPRAEDTPQLQEPRCCEVIDVREHGPGVHDIEIPILERQVRKELFTRK